MSTRINSFNQTSTVPVKSSMYNIALQNRAKYKSLNLSTTDLSRALCSYNKLNPKNIPKNKKIALPSVRDLNNFLKTGQRKSIPKPKAYNTEAPITLPGTPERPNPVRYNTASGMQTINYTVKKGDTLGQILNSLYSKDEVSSHRGRDNSYDIIKKLNGPYFDISRLSVNQTIILPRPDSYSASKTEDISYIDDKEFQFSDHFDRDVFSNIYKALRFHQGEDRVTKEKMDNTVKNALSYCPNLKELDSDTQTVILYMSYVMGGGSQNGAKRGLHSFSNLQKALKINDKLGIYREITNSNWYKKIQSNKYNRSDHIVARIELLNNTTTQGLSKNHPYMREMELVQSQMSILDPAISNLSKRDKQNIFDIAHLILKETLPGKTISDNEKLEMKIIALVVKNRLSVANNNKNFRNLFGKAKSDDDYQSVIFNKYQFSPFNDFSVKGKSSCLHVNSMKKFYTPAKWKAAIQAATQVYIHDKEAIPQKYHKVTFYHAPYVEPNWANDSNYKEIGHVGGHKFYEYTRVMYANYSRETPNPIRHG